jgi:hypothetical protein
MFAREFLFQDRFLKCCDSNALTFDVTDTKRDFFGPDQIAAIRLGAEPHANLTLTPILRQSWCSRLRPPWWPAPIRSMHRGGRRRTC